MCLWECRKSLYNIDLSKKTQYRCKKVMHSSGSSSMEKKKILGIVVSPVADDDVARAFGALYSFSLFARYERSSRFPFEKANTVNLNRSYLERRCSNQVHSEQWASTENGSMSSIRPDGCILFEKEWNAYILGQCQKCASVPSVCGLCDESNSCFFSNHLFVYRFPNLEITGT